MRINDHIKRSPIAVLSAIGFLLYLIIYVVIFDKYEFLAVVGTGKLTFCIVHSLLFVAILLAYKIPVIVAAGGLGIYCVYNFLYTMSSVSSISDFYNFSAWFCNTVAPILFVIVVIIGVVCKHPPSCLKFICIAAFVMLLYYHTDALGSDIEHLNYLKRMDSYLEASSDRTTEHIFSYVLPINVAELSRTAALLGFSLWVMKREPAVLPEESVVFPPEETFDDLYIPERKKEQVIRGKTKSEGAGIKVWMKKHPFLSVFLALILAGILFILLDTYKVYRTPEGAAIAAVDALIDENEAKLVHLLWEFTNTENAEDWIREFDYYFKDSEDGYYKGYKFPYEIEDIERLRGDIEEYREYLEECYDEYDYNWDKIKNSVTVTIKIDPDYEDRSGKYYDFDLYGYITVHLEQVGASWKVSRISIDSYC